MALASKLQACLFGPSTRGVLQRLITLGVLGCCVIGPGLSAQGGYARAMELLASEDYRGALAALESEEDLLLRRDGEAELFYLASDYAAALRVAETGLVSDPDHLKLRFRAAASALWLNSGERALFHSEALAQSVQASTLTPLDRNAWSDLAQDYQSRAKDLLAVEGDRQGAVSFARSVSFAGLALVLLALVWALRPRHTT
ncbi:MAG: hypothetical protein ACI8QS_000263 [Planctomycetota bacterium]